MIARKASASTTSRRLNELDEANHIFWDRYKQRNQTLRISHAKHHKAASQKNTA